MQVDGLKHGTDQNALIRGTSRLGYVILAVRRADFLEEMGSHYNG